MRLIPVLDIKGGIAVHAVQGKRELYKPLKSLICSSTNPLEVAKAYKEALKVKELYVADLDAIAGTRLNLKLYTELSELGLRAMIDAGVNNAATARRLMETGVVVVVGAETLTSFKALRDIVREVGASNVVLSLDLYGGQLLSKIEEVSDPLEAALEAEKAGVREAILLSLDNVGTLKGVDLELIKRIKERSKLSLLVGGVRSLEDSQRLRDLGITGVLIATALHTGLIDVEEARRRGLEAMKRLARLEGIFSEPAASSTIAGLARLIDESKIYRGERVVCVITGERAQGP